MKTQRFQAAQVCDRCGRPFTYDVITYNPRVSSGPPPAHCLPCVATAEACLN
jgi:hypothetical protein